MMTSFAFIMGLVPLVIANGPGADSMIAVGVPVLAGMLAASIFGIFLIPMLYVVFQRLTEGRGSRKTRASPHRSTLLDAYQRRHELGSRSRSVAGFARRYRS